MARALDEVRLLSLRCFGAYIVPYRVMTDAERGWATVRAVSGVWRWRHNPLRRRTDLCEAWVALVALLLMLLAAPAAGLMSASLTDDALQQAVRAQRDRRHLTTAVVVRRAVGPARFVDEPEGSVAERAARTVSATWKAPDGTVRRGTVPTTSRKTEPGSRVRIWIDDEGLPAPRPMDMATAHTHAVLAGIGASMVMAGLVEAARRLVVWRMMQRRYVRLDHAWAKAGPDWGRTGTGS